MKRLRKVLACLLLCALLAGMAASPAALADGPEGGDIDRCIALNYFNPEIEDSVDGEMTRAGFTAALCRFFGWEPTADPRAIYEDVSVNEWYAGAVETAYRQGAVTGQDITFRPDEPITRGEAASMLVRALGYGSLAGLSQNTVPSFQDVHANSGCILMACSLGLMDGTSAATFSPGAHITREEAAAIIMRLHDRLRGGAIGRIGIATSAEGLPDLEGYEAVGVFARLTYNGSPQLVIDLKDDEVKAIQASAAAAGAKHLLYASGNTYHFREGDAQALADTLFQAAEAGGYDGIFVDISGLTTIYLRDEFTAAARLLREKLGERPLYVAAEAPSWNGKAGYDYAALGEVADRLVLRFTRTAEKVGNMSVAPLEPLEQLYYGMSRLRGVVDIGKLTLLLTSSGSSWNGKTFTSVSGGDIASLLKERGTQSHYSTRYACAYLTRESGGTVWYLNGQSIRERTQLALLFGGGRVCLSDLNAALPEVLEAMP